MRMTITGMGHFHPEHEIDNAFFDSLGIESSAEWVESSTGIKSRRSVLSREDIWRLRRGETTTQELRKQGRIMTIADMAAPAWGMASERSKVNAAELDLMLCGTSIPDYDIPANACVVASRVGASCTAFDVNSACSSFVINLSVVEGQFATKRAKCAAIINPERYSTRVDFNDRASCILWGDGCAVAVIESDCDKPGLEVLDMQVRSFPEHYEHVTMPVGEWFSQNGRAVQKFAVTKTVAITQELLERNSLNAKDVNWFVGHQANFRMLHTAVDMLGLDESRHLSNVVTHGNQGGAGAPDVLSTYWDKFKPGDVIVVAVVGAGLTWGAALLKRTT